MYLNLEGKITVRSLADDCGFPQFCTDFPGAPRGRLGRSGRLRVGCLEPGCSKTRLRLPATRAGSNPNYGSATFTMRGRVAPAALTGRVRGALPTKTVFCFASRRSPTEAGTEVVGVFLSFCRPLALRGSLARAGTESLASIGIRGTVSATCVSGTGLVAVITGIVSAATFSGPADVAAADFAATESPGVSIDASLRIDSLPKSTRTTKTSIPLPIINPRLGIAKRAAEAE